MLFDAAIFDLDKTLVYVPRRFEYEWTKHCLEMFMGRFFHEEEVSRYLKLPINERESQLQKWGFENAEEYLNMWLTPKALETRMQYVKSYRDSMALLAFRQIVPLGLVTSAPYELGKKEVNVLEKNLGVKDIFDAEIYICGSDYKKKPHPDALHACIKRLGVIPERTLYCGDKQRDVEMAQNADVVPVLVDRSQKSSQCYERPIVVNCLTDILELLNPHVN